MANFVRELGVILFLALIALGFFLIHQDRDNQAVSTGALVARGLIPIFIGFVLAWGGLEVADRLDSRPCPRCGRRVRLGAYRCPNCAYDFRRAAVPQN